MMNDKHFFNRVWLMLLCVTSLHATSAIKKPWTILVYVGGVNNLNDFAYGDLAEMMKVGSNDAINVLTHFNVFDDDGSTKTMRLYVEHDNIQLCEAPTSEDSGDVRTLMGALEWAMTDFPSEHIAVVLWNHGSGIKKIDIDPQLRGICYDDNTHNHLTDRDCLQALSWAQWKFNDGKKLDIVACDACLMATLECAYPLIECADYFVASQETIPGFGYEYARVLDDFKHHVLTPREFAQSLVAAYKEEYENTPDFTLSAVDLSKLEPLVMYTNRIADLLSYGLRTRRKSYVKKYINRARERALSFDEGIYFDIDTFYKKLTNYTYYMRLPRSSARRLVSYLKKSRLLLDQCVIAKTASRSYRKAGGLSLYFPENHIDDAYYNLCWTEDYPEMLKLLERFI